MSESEQPEGLIGVRTLWNVSVSVGDEGALVPYGTHSADAAAVLRIFDYRTENFPEEKSVLVKTTVVEQLENVEELRKNLAQTSVEKESPDVHSG